jgi:hypothetical protein
MRAFFEIDASFSSLTQLSSSVLTTTCSQAASEDSTKGADRHERWLHNMHIATDASGQEARTCTLGVHCGHSDGSSFVNTCGCDRSAVTFDFHKPAMDS